MEEKMRHLRKETETIQKNQMEIFELKNTISEIRNSLNGLNSRMEMKEKRVHELEDRSIDMIYSEIQREKG